MTLSNEWRIKQGGLIVASGCAPDEEDARREAAHYAAQYALEGGPVEVFYRIGKAWRKAATISVEAKGDIPLV